MVPVVLLAVMAGACSGGDDTSESDATAAIPCPSLDVVGDAHGSTAVSLEEAVDATLGIPGAVTTLDCKYTMRSTLDLFVTSAVFATKGDAEAAYRMVEEAAGADAEGVDESTFVINNDLGEVYRHRGTLLCFVVGTRHFEPDGVDNELALVDAFCP